MVERTAVIAALDAVIDPVSGQGLVAAGLVQGLVVAEDRAGFALEVDHTQAAAYAPVRDAAEAALKAIPGMARVSVILTAETKPVAAPRTAALSKAAVDQGRAKAPVPTDRPAHVRRVCDAIKSMIGLGFILNRGAGRQDAQVGVKLLAVGVDDHRARFTSHLQRQRRLARRGRAGDQSD